MLQIFNALEIFMAVASNSCTIEMIWGIENGVPTCPLFSYLKSLMKHAVSFFSAINESDAHSDMG